MSVNFSNIKLEDLSALLMSADISKGDDMVLLTQANSIISELMPLANGWESKTVSKCSAIIKDYASLLFAFYDDKFQVFDNADSLYAFDKKYEVRIAPRTIDYKYLETLLLLHLLQVQCLDHAYDRLARKTLTNALGRFLVLYYGNLDVDNIELQSSSEHPFYQIFSLSLKCLSLYEWEIQDVVYLKLAILNLLDVLGPNRQGIVKEAWVKICEECKDSMTNLNEHACEAVLQCCDKFYRYHLSDRIIEPLDTTWLYAYIYKQRFGYLYCKKITKSPHNSFYPYTFRTTSICFKGLIERITGNSPKVVLFEKGIVRRSSEYRPSESNFLFNYTSMKFE